MKIEAIILIVTTMMTTSLALGFDKSAEKKACPVTMGTALELPADQKFQITGYDKETNSYQTVSVRYPGEGIWDSTLEALAASVPSIQKQLDKIRDNRNLIVGEMYKTEKPLASLNKKEKEARRGCSQ